MNVPARPTVPLKRTPHETTVEAWKCLRCAYAWEKKSEREPVQCPSCRSALWNRERVRPVLAKPTAGS